jgi:hypothetical protein
MANKGRNQNSSQFMITLKPCPHLDGKHVVFGQVIEGIEVIRQIAKVPTDANERPKIKVIIYESGDLDTRRIHLIEDPFKETMAALYQDRVRNEKIKIMGPEEAEEYRKKKKPSAFDIIQNYSDEDISNKNQSESEEENEEEEENALRNQASEDEQEKEEENVINKIKEKMGNAGVKKFQELKAKINEVRNLNMKAVQEENLKSQDPEWDKKQMREEYKQSRNELKDKMLQQGIPEDKFYSLQSINKSEIRNSKNEKKQKSATFGWDVFNTDSLFRAYKKRIKNMPFDKALYEDQIKDPQISSEISEERKNLLNMDIEEQLLKRKRYSRRRAFYEDHDVTYINDRNMNFNKKLNRFFSKEAAEVKANLERGTAL